MTGIGNILNNEISQTTDMINREVVKNLVEVFYQPVFKTFYINSLDGENFIKQIGVFVSLGITTSMKVLEDIKNTIQSNENFSATIVEISSKKVGGQFLNTITKTSPTTQYKLTEFDSSVMNREQAEKELERLRTFMTPEEDLRVLQEYAPKISRLSDLIDKLDASKGWDAHLIQKEENGNYRIFHQYVNYRKEGDIEYRLGIYVTEKKK